MNLRIKDQLAKNILKKYQDNGRSFENLKLTRPERELERRVDERVTKVVAENKGTEVGAEDSRGSRVGRVSGYSFVDPAPIKFHKPTTTWDKIKDKLKGWLHA